MIKHKLGWIPDLPDFRDRIFSVAKPIPLPPIVDLRPKLPPIYDQGDLGSCTANAIAATYDFERKRQGKTFITPSRLFIYWNEREMEGTISEDSGAMIRDGIKSVADDGVCPEVDWPYDITKFEIQPANSCYATAQKNQALNYSRIPANLTPMLQCLASGFPFTFGFSVYESFESRIVAKTGIVPMPKLREKQLGGHAVDAVGYNLLKRYFLVRNSWGIKWGIRGYFWMPFEYLASEELADDRWVIKLVE